VSTTPSGTNTTVCLLEAFLSTVHTTSALLPYTIVTGPTKGSLSGTGSTRTYTRNNGTSGTDTLTYKVTDRGDPDNCTGFPSATCDGPLSSDTKTVTITIINGAPSATDATVHTNEDTSKLQRQTTRQNYSHRTTSKATSFATNGTLFQGNSTPPAD